MYLLINGWEQKEKHLCETEKHQKKPAGNAFEGKGRKLALHGGRPLSLNALQTSKHQDYPV